jgi:glucosyl-dolichyl phosphate glucuronosyltransferase
MNEVDSSVAVTVVIPTYRRAESLAVVLNALDKQRAPWPWDVVVVDSAGNDKTTDALIRNRRSMSNSGPRRITLVGARQPGVSIARNRGLEETTTPVVVFVDDDVVASEGWLESLATPVIQGTFDAVAGPVIIDNGVRAPAWLHGPVTRYIGVVWFSGTEPRPLQNLELIPGGNSAFRLSIFSAIGGFNPSFGPVASRLGANEDVELTRRLILSGVRLGYAPSALAYHRVVSGKLRLSWILRRAYAQGRADWMLEADDLSRRPDGGIRANLVSLRANLTYCLRTQPRECATAVFVATELARTSGFLREAIRSLGSRVTTTSGTKSPSSDL